jgi:ribosomal-protein-serine acetyltransferase
MTISIDKDVCLELTSARHADALYDAVDNNREHLSEFLPWVSNMQSASDFLQYVQRCELLYRQREEVSFVIMAGEVAIGRIGLHYMNLQNKNASIGYWLTKDAEGKGIITKSCEKLIAYGFRELGLHRIEIKAAVDNVRSRAIPQKLHFKKEGVLREAELVGGRFLDIVVFSLLRSEWGG